MTYTTEQALRFGPMLLEATEAQPAPYFLAGRKFYMIGTTSGALEPVGAEHLVGEMGGVWAHPVKFLDGWYLAIEDSGGRHDLLPYHFFEGHLSDATLYVTHEPLRIVRTDFVVDDEAAAFSLISISNTSSTTWSGTFGFVAQINIRPTWFSGWEHGEIELHHDQGLVIAFDTLWQGRWGVAIGSATMQGDVVFSRRDDQPTAELRYDLTLAPGEQTRLEFLIACDHQRGHDGAQQLFHKLAGRGWELLKAKYEHYCEIALDGVTLKTPDETVNNDWILAKANLLMLEADYAPYLPGFLLAGIPEYPQLFGCDNTYTTPGATGAGFTTSMRSTLSLLGDYARRACGRVPHEITTNGRVFNPGNTQETPQFAIAVWDYFRWTGDRAFLASNYPICREGMLEYLPSMWDGDGDGYPSGDAMVERHGMGSLKLDSACYVYGAWQALAEMGRALGRPEAERFERMAGEWREHFERDWWMPQHGLYADSLHADYRPQLDGHWTQIVPIQLGIARPDRAVQVLDRIEREFTNRWGLVHTRDREDRVWTLPTGLLVLAQLRHGRTEHALRLLNNISLTARYGMLGAFKELIPEGLCFVQLWSAGLYAQCVLEGVFGLEPRAHEHRLTITPALPREWPSAALHNLRVGAHVLNLTVTPTGCTIEQISGPQPIAIHFRARGTAVATIATTGYSRDAAEQMTPPTGDPVPFVVGVGQRVELRIDDGQATLHYVDQRAAEVKKRP